MTWWGCPRRVVVVAVTAAFLLICDPSAAQTPVVETLLSGFCNVTGVAVVADFNAINFAAAQASRSNVQLLSPTVDLAAANPSLSMVVLDGGCNVVYVIPRSSVLIQQFYNSSLPRSTPLGAWARIAAGTTPPTSLGGAQDGTGSGAQFNRPAGLYVVAAGELITVDTENHAIRRIRVAAGVGTVDTVVGRLTVRGFADGDPTNVARLASPAWLAMVLAAPGLWTCYVVDTGNAAVRSFNYDAISGPGFVATVVGGPTKRGFVDGSLSSALFDVPVGLAVTNVAGRVVLFVTEYRLGALRRIDLTAGTVTTIAGLRNGQMVPGVLSRDGSGTSAVLRGPIGVTVAVDPTARSEPLFVIDSAVSQMRRCSLVSTSAATVTTVVGAPGSAAVDGRAVSAARFYRPTASVMMILATGQATTDMFLASNDILFVMDTAFVRIIANASSLPLRKPSISLSVSLSRRPTPSNTISSTPSGSSEVTESVSTSMSRPRTRTKSRRSPSLSNTLIMSPTKTIPLPTPSRSQSRTVTPPIPRPAPRVHTLGPALQRAIETRQPTFIAFAVTLAADAMATAGGLVGFPTLALSAARSRAIMTVVLCRTQEGIENVPFRGVHWFGGATLGPSEFSELVVVCTIELAIVLAGCAALHYGFGSALGKGAVIVQDRQVRHWALGFAATTVVSAWLLPAIGGLTTATVHTYSSTERIFAALLLLSALLIAGLYFAPTFGTQRFADNVVTITGVTLPPWLEHQMVTRLSELSRQDQVGILRLASEGAVDGATAELRWRDRFPDRPFTSTWQATIGLARDARLFFHRNYLLVEFTAGALCTILAASFVPRSFCETALMPASTVVLMHCGQLLVFRPYHSLLHNTAAIAMGLWQVGAAALGLWMSFDEGMASRAVDYHVLEGLGFAHCALVFVVFVVQGFAVLAGSRFDLGPIQHWRRRWPARRADQALNLHRPLQRAGELAEKPSAGSALSSEAAVARILAWRGDHAALLLVPEKPEEHEALPIGEHDRLATTLLRLRERQESGTRSPPRQLNPLLNGMSDPKGATELVTPVMSVPLLSTLHAARRYEEEYASGIRSVHL